MVHVSWNFVYVKTSVTAGLEMGHVTYMILLGLPIESLGPSMTAPPSHVFEKFGIFAQKRCKLLKLATQPLLKIRF